MITLQSALCWWQDRRHGLAMVALRRCIARLEPADVDHHVDFTRSMANGLARLERLDLGRRRAERERHDRAERNTIPGVPKAPGEHQCCQCGIHVGVDAHGREVKLDGLPHNRVLMLFLSRVRPKEGVVDEACDRSRCQRWTSAAATSPLMESAHPLARRRAPNP